MIALLVILSFAAFAESSCPWESKVNGCSVPLGAPFPYKEAFKPVCNRHDVCYICGKRYGWSQSTCDNVFKRDMEAKCRQLFHNRKRFFPSIIAAIGGGAQIAAELAKWPTITGRYPHCMHGAKLYFLAVKHFGHLFYVKRSPSWCGQRCARDKGNPYR
eukprot:Seg852.16 transcript_id=Seg852.16/GoldUCD/mRNA.D3Y31 product="Conodipine-M alpha chain" protein_id=Seg852.16/GoldUCD/D3Y31